MSNDFLIQYVAQIRRAGQDALTFVEGFDKAAFLADKRTQQAVVMCLLIMGEVASGIIKRFPAVASDRISLHEMRGMRNRIAHGYFAIDLEIVWDTVHTSVPNLLEHLADLE